MNTLRQFNSSGLFFICLGIILLLNTSGILDWRIWGFFAKFILPFIFLNIGLSILMKDRFWKEVAKGVLLVLFITGSFVNYAVSPNYNSSELQSDKQAIAGDGQLFSINQVDLNTSFADVTFTENAEPEDWVYSSAQILPGTEVVLDFMEGLPAGVSFKLNRDKRPDFWFLDNNAGQGEEVNLAFNPKLSAKILTLDNSFGNVNGALTQVKFDTLDMNNSFGNIKFVFTEATMPAVLEIDNSFGNVEIDIPDNFQIISSNSASFGGISFFGSDSGNLMPVPAPGAKVVTINADTSFGNIRIY